MSASGQFIDPDRLVPEIPTSDERQNTTTFPSPDDRKPKPSPDSQDTTKSDLTSSDKLSALPSSPPMRRNIRRSLEPLPDSRNSSPNWLMSRSNSVINNATFPRVNKSENTFGAESPRARHSGESDRMSLPTMRSVRNSFTRVHRSSDPAIQSPVIAIGRSIRDSVDSLVTPASRSPSRVPSPLRLFQQWSANLRNNYREDPFIPINPFKLHFRVPCLSRSHSDDEGGVQTCCGNPSICLPLPVTVAACSPASIQPFLAACLHFIINILPRQLYLHALLRLPSLYFSRVARIFEDAEVSRPDIERMIDVCSAGAFMTDAAAYTGALMNGSVVGSGGHQTHHHVPALLPFPDEWIPPAVSPALRRFKYSWEEFIDSLLREWKTLNIVSALLLSAILTMLQIPNAVDDPLIHHASLFSLICALMSLSYGCIYIVRFGMMRSMFRASKWAEEARKRNTSIWWNVWVLLAMPAVWLAWSMIFFILSILSFVWRTGSTNDPPDGRPPLSPHAALAVRISITVLFGIGLVYFAMMVNTLRRYGTEFEDRGKARTLEGVRGDDVVPRDARGEGRGTEPGAGERRGRERRRRRARRERKRDDAVQSDADDEKERKLAIGLGLSGFGMEGGAVVVDEIPQFHRVEPSG